MAYPAGSVHVVYSGTLVGGEIWAMGYWVDYTGDDGSPGAFQSSFEELIDAQVEDLTTLLQTGVAGALLAADAYQYAGGSNRANLNAHVDLNINAGGTGRHPDQCSLVITQLTGLPGRSYRGRTYLPFNGAALSAESNADAQASQELCTQVATTFADVLNAGPALGWAPAVVSSVRGAITPMTAVRVDSRVDTQRRRAESVTVRYRASALVNNT